MYTESDKFFGSEAAGHAYCSFCKHSSSPSQETSVNMTNHLGAVVTDVADSFKAQLSDKARTFPEHGGEDSTPATKEEEMSYHNEIRSHKLGRFYKKLLENYRIFFSLPPSTRCKVDVRFFREVSKTSRRNQGMGYPL